MKNNTYTNITQSISTMNTKFAFRPYNRFLTNGFSLFLLLIFLMGSGEVSGQKYDKIPISTTKNKNSGNIECTAFIQDNSGENVHLTANDNKGEIINVSQKSSGELVVKIKIKKIIDRELKGGVISLHQSPGTAHLENGKVSKNNTEDVRLTYAIKPDDAIRSGVLTVICEVKQNTAGGKKSEKIEIEIPYKIDPPRPPVKKDSQADKLYKEIVTTGLEGDKEARIKRCLYFLEKYLFEIRRGQVKKILKNLYDGMYTDAEKESCEALMKFKDEHPKSEEYGGFVTKAINKCPDIEKSEPSPSLTTPAAPKEVTQADVDDMWRKTEKADNLAAYKKFVRDYKSETKAEKYMTTAQKKVNEILGKDSGELTKLKVALTKNNRDSDKCTVCLNFLKKKPASHYVRMRKEAEEGKKKYCTSYISLSTLEGLVNIEINWGGLKEFDIEIFENRGEGYVPVPAANLAIEEKMEGSVFKRVYKYVEGVSHKFVVKDKNGKILGEPEILALRGKEGISREGESVRIQGGYHPLKMQWVSDDKRTGFIDLSKEGEAGQRVFELSALGLQKGTYTFTALSNNMEIGEALEGVEVISKGGWLRWAVLGVIVFVLGLIALILGKDIKEGAADYAIFRTVFGLTKKSTKKFTKKEDGDNTNSQLNKSTVIDLSIEALSKELIVEERKMKSKILISKKGSPVKDGDKKIKIKKHGEAFMDAGEGTLTAAEVADIERLEMKNGGYKVFDLSEIWEDTAVSKVLIKLSCAAAIDEQVSTIANLVDLEGKAAPEIGGFILGRYGKIDGKYVVAYEEYVPVHVEMAKADVYEVEFTNQSFVELDRKWDDFRHLELVSWFHTHPGHSLFLSKPDLRIHIPHFPKPYQIATEIEPLTADIDLAFFTWQEDGKEPNNTSNRVGKKWFSFDEVNKWRRVVKKWL